MSAPSGFEKGSFVRIHLAKWIEQTDGKSWFPVERAHARGMVGRVIERMAGGGVARIRVEWLNPEPGTTWNFTEAPTDYFQPLSPLEVLARCETPGWGDDA